MFRKMRRFRQQLSDEETKEILRTEKRGVLAVLGDEEYPYAVPLNFIYDEKNSRILFHGAREGHKLDAVRKHPKASFCVHDQGYVREGEWAYNVKSVIVFGKVSEITDPAETIEAARSLGLKYYPDAESVEEELAKAGSRVLCLSLDIEHMTGKLVNES